MDEAVTWRIFYPGGAAIPATIKVMRRTLDNSTTLLDDDSIHQFQSGTDTYIDVRVPDKTTALFWALMLNEDASGLEALHIPTRKIYHLIPFERKFIRCSALSEKFRAWLLNHWSKFKTVVPSIRGKRRTMQLLDYTILAAEVREPTVFHSATYLWFLHSVGAETTHDFSLAKQLVYLRPVLTNLMAARTGFTEKLVTYLAYDRKKDGRVQSQRCPSNLCAATKTFAYYRALRKTFCWPVYEAMRTRSIHDVLEGLKKFTYTSCDSISGLNPADVKSQMPPHVDERGNKESADPACTCNEAAFQAAVEKKVRGASNALLCKWDANGRIDCFRGLCLDCVLNTAGVDVDEQYWDHIGNGIFDAGDGEGKRCAVKHGQPDWYYSFMGRPERLRTYKAGRGKKFFGALARLRRREAALIVTAANWVP